MDEFVVKILSIEKLTHDVNKIRVERPEGYDFIPGQATEVSINRADLKDERRPFTFTSLTEKPYLEFMIKSYDNHNGVTKIIGTLKQNDELILHDVWGAISYKGQGIFIAGGAGITPFISILRDLRHKNKLNGNQLIFSNKTKQDIILNAELSEMLGNNFINVLTREKAKDYFFGRIDASFLKAQIKDFNQCFYVCGPDEFVKEIDSILTTLGAKPDTIVFEK